MEKTDFFSPDTEIQELLHAVQTGVLLCSGACSVTFANSVAQDFFSRAGLDAIGQPCHKALFGSEAQCEGCPAERADLEGKRQAVTLKAQQVAIHEERYARAAAGKDLSGALLERLREYQEMIEEFKVSLFAQELGTALPVSAKRLDKKWQEIDQLC